MRTRIIASTAALLLVLGCDAADEPDADVGEPTDDVGAAEVSIVDNAFEPSSIEVAPGETVDWTNTGSLPHTVTFEGDGPDSGNLEAGGSFSHTFDDPGEYAYACAIHPAMQGTVTVTG